MPTIRASRRAETVALLLAKAKVPRLDAEVLLAYVLNKNRAWLLAHGDEAIPHSVLERFQSLLLRRQSGEPLAYIVGEKEFYGRMFTVDSRVMIPRPSTEGLIDLVFELLGKSEIRNLKSETNPKSEIRMTKKLDTGVCGAAFLKSPFAIRSSPFAVVDVGTGSGCIAVTLALELPEATIVASDISSEALDVARENAKRHDVLNRITFIQDSLIPVSSTRVHQYPFLLVSNPPYLRTGRDEDPSTAREPREALYAGSNGLDVLLPLVEQAKQHPRCIGFVIECLEQQVAQLTTG